MAMPEESLHEFLDQQEEVNESHFKVTTEEHANWALRKLGKIEEQKQEDISLAESEVSKIEAWLEQKQEKYQRDTDYFQGLLAYYAVTRRNEDEKFKSLKLPNGRIRFKKQQPKWELDDDKVVKALKKIGKENLIKTKETPKTTEIKKAFKINGKNAVDPETGEVLEGVKVEHQEDKFEWGVE